MRRRTTFGAVTVAAAVAAGVATAAVLGGPAAPSARAASALPAFNSCSALLDYAERQALRLVSPYGFGGGFVDVAVEEAAEPAAGGEGAGDSAPPATSEPTGTNVQEAGVDEPDTVKTNGTTIFAIAQGQLQALDVSSGAPQLIATMSLPQGFGHQLLLHGSTLLVVSSDGGWAEPLPAVTSDILPYPAPSPTTYLTEIDVSNPAAMQIGNTVSVQASFVGARLTGSTARVVLTSQPSGFAFAYPETGEPAELEATEARNRELIQSSTPANWIPTYRVTTETGHQSAARRLVPCGEVRHPRAFSGLGTLTVMTLDLDGGVAVVDSDAVMTGGDTIYASTTGLYVATQQWTDPVLYEEAPDAVPPTVKTAIHKFDVSSPESTDYRASGEVPGYLLNQWSLSEQDGFLRVVSTDAPLWWGGEDVESVSTLTVLNEADGRLAAVGKVGGLGRGERVYAVRFIGDLGYVVTFRQIDPLYVVDVSDPASPVVRGELKIPGYSAYLHPIGGDLLVGIGQDATDEGVPLGTQVSIFDIADPANPARLHNHGLGQGWSAAEWDHHAFTYYAAGRLAVIPFETSTWSEDGSISNWSSGAVVLRVGRGGVEQLRTIAHEGIPSGDPNYPVYPVAVWRSLVVGETLYTLSESGLKGTSLATLEDTGWAPFPVAAPPVGTEPSVP